MKISASIIVYNEADNIEELCKSLDWVDEIVIVDSDSKDNSAAIARRFTDKVFNHEFRGFKDKHEFADAQTGGDWILWMDADERVSPELKTAIENLKSKNPAELPDGFKIARRTFHLGRWIKHSGWYPDYQMRFYKKSASGWGGIAPHETARVSGRVEILQGGEILHYPNADLSEQHRKIDYYSNLAADYWFEKGKSVGGFYIFFRAVAGFVRSYFIKQGFRDGVPGLILAMFAGYSVFLKYAKVWEKRQMTIKHSPDNQD